MGFPGGISGKEPTYQCRRHKVVQVWSLDGEDSLEKEMATHSSILAWRIPWTEEPGGLYVYIYVYTHTDFAGGTSGNSPADAGDVRDAGLMPGS